MEREEGALRPVGLEVEVEAKEVLGSTFSLFAPVETSSLALVMRMEESGLKENGRK